MFHQYFELFVNIS